MKKLIILVRSTQFASPILKHHLQLQIWWHDNQLPIFHEYFLPDLKFSRENSCSVLGLVPWSFFYKHRPHGKTGVLKFLSIIFFFVITIFTNFCWICVVHLMRTMKVVDINPLHQNLSCTFNIYKKVHQRYKKSFINKIEQKKFID